MAGIFVVLYSIHENNTCYFFTLVRFGVGEYLGPRTVCAFNGIRQRSDFHAVGQGKAHEEKQSEGVADAH